VADITAGAPVLEVHARPAIELVISGAAEDQVIAGTAIERVCPAPAADHVGALCAA
jgi:hypothetical protein